MTGESVTRAFGQDSKCCVGVDQTLRYFVHGTITTNSEHSCEAIVHRLHGEFCRMTSLACEVDRSFNASISAGGDDSPFERITISPSRVLVDNEEYLLIFAHKYDPSRQSSPKLSIQHYHGARIPSAQDKVQGLG